MEAQEEIVSIPVGISMFGMMCGWLDLICQKDMEVDYSKLRELYFITNLTFRLANYRCNSSRTQRRNLPLRSSIFASGSK